MMNETYKVMQHRWKNDPAKEWHDCLSLNCPGVDEAEVETRIVERSKIRVPCILLSVAKVKQGKWNGDHIQKALNDDQSRP